MKNNLKRKIIRNRSDIISEEKLAYKKKKIFKFILIMKIFFLNLGTFFGYKIIRN